MNPYCELLAGIEIPEELRRLELQGRLADAEAWIDGALECGEAAGERKAGKRLTTARRAELEWERERIRRWRRDFSLADDAMIEKLEPLLGAVTADDLARWRKRGAIQWMELDGEIRYHRREPANLLRESAAARRMRTVRRAADRAARAASGEPEPPRPERKIPLHRYAERALDAARRLGRPDVLPLHHRFDFTIRVRPGIVPRGEIIRCWIPFPQEYQQQTGVRLLETFPALAPSSAAARRAIAPNGSPHRTLYLEQPAAGKSAPTEFRAAFEYVCAAWVPQIDPRRVRPVDPADPALAEHLDARPPHLFLDAEVRALASIIIGRERNPYRQARAIFLWIAQNVRYRAEFEYSVLPSVLRKIFSTRQGDCGLYSFLFIALCRAAGIPARWQSGWETLPGKRSMHDWAEFYIAPYGWLPADPTYGLLKSDDTDVREFFCGNMDAYRMISNLDWGREFYPRKTHWRSDTIDLQRAELEWTGGNLFFDDWEYKVDFTRHPADP